MIPKKRRKRENGKHVYFSSRSQQNTEQLGGLNSPNGWGLRMNKIVIFQRHTSAALVVAAVIAVSGMVLRAQDPAEQSPAATGQNAMMGPESPRTMTLHVQVSESNGHSVEGLQESDFTSFSTINSHKKLLGFRAVGMRGFRNLIQYR